MKKYGFYIVIVLLCILQILSVIQIVKLKNDIDNTGSYLSQKIDNVTSKVNMLGSYSDQMTIQKEPALNPKLEANISNDVRVELPDLNKGQFGTQDELNLFSDFITNLKYEDVKTIIANAYPTIIHKNKGLTPEETLKLLTMVKNITPTVITKIDNSSTKGGWSIYIQTSNYGVTIGEMGSLITCAFDDKQGWYIFGDPNVQLYNQIYDFINSKQKQ